MIAKPADLFETTWGRLRLWCSAMSTDNGRTQVVHELATATSADEHPVDDRGPKPRRVSCSLLFDEMVRDPIPPLERFEAFLAQVNSGAEELFTHPIEGSFFVKVDDFTYDIDDDSNISNARAVFIASGEIQPIAPARTASAALTGSDDVTALAGTLADELAAVGIDSTVPADAIAAANSWAATDTIPTRDVLNDAAATSSAIDALVTDNAMDADFALWSAYVAATMLQDAFRSAAQAATTETASLFYLKVAAPTSVLALVTRIYGGAEADARERQVRALNDIRSPGGLLATGDELAMPATSSLRIAA